MKETRIYIDTSVIGGCCDDEFKPWSLGLMRDFQIGVFKPVISEVVATEIEHAPQEVLQHYYALLELDPEFTSINAEVERLVQAYLDHEILDVKFSRDLLHVGLAAVAAVDVVVSWNFKHIVRFDV